MKLNHKEYSFPSATGVCTIYGQSWAPEEVKGVVQIHHGMAEHSERYIAFAQYLCSHGFAVFIHDMANHGKSNQTPELTGYFGEKDGWKNLIQDMNTMMELAKQEYPQLPYFIFGHSMGSFVSRCFIAKYASEVTGAIICGTAGSNALAGVSITLSNAIAKVKGSTYKSTLLDKAGFGAYNKHCEGRTKFDWLSRVPEEVDKYIADPMCGFLFSAKGFGDLSHLLVYANSAAWYQAMPLSLPVCFISGDKDPVGAYGKGVESVYHKLKNSGHNVSMKLYGGARHELLNEIVKDSCMEDVANYFDNVMDGKVTVAQ